jgi:hypothetical protein
VFFVWIYDMMESDFFERRDFNESDISQPQRLFCGNRNKSPAVRLLYRKWEKGIF